MSDFEGHGWSVVSYGTSKLQTAGDQIVALHIGRLPGRKQICLYGHNGTPGMIDVYAYFPTEKKAQEALTIFDRLMKR